MSVSGSVSQIKGKRGSSVYSVGTIQTRKNRSNLREEMIQKKIKEIFKDKENRMYRTIEQTIYDDRLKIYKLKKSEYEEELSELEADKKKLLKRKKNKKEKMKLLKKNAKETLYYITKAL